MNDAGERQLGYYTILRQLGAGGMGEVYLGDDKRNPLRYCPNDSTTRGAMAVFLVRTFVLQ